MDDPISVDDKAKVPISFISAIEQAPLMMHVNYEIILPDHDFAKAAKHKLTPFVHPACEMKSHSSKADPEITYSGPTYIAIRSGKYDSSTAHTHCRYIDHLLDLEEIKEIVESGNSVKPIFVIFCDSGPGEDLRFPKTLDVAIIFFKRYSLDALLVSTHAPVVSAYNQLERRMAPLSKALTRILVPHETYGTVLDSLRKTIQIWK